MLAAERGENVPMGEKRGFALLLCCVAMKGNEPDR